MAELVDCDGDESCSSAHPPRRPLDKFEDGAVECATPEPDRLPFPSTPTVVTSSDKEEISGSVAPVETMAASPSNDCLIDHSPKSLPPFRDSNTCMWIASHAANSPSEDRSSSLVNVLLKPRNVTACDESSQYSLIRLSLWSVIDGHGGGCVATYASEVLLPHIAASVSRVLDCDIVDRGECRINGELRDANALDLDGLIRSSEKSRSNPKSIRYRSPREPDEQDEADSPMLTSTMEEDAFESGISVASYDTAETAPSVKTSGKAKTSEAMQDGPTGTHSPGEVARITHAINDSFLAVDEGWINSIDVLSTNQSACQINGQWNVGACALVAFTIQRLDWTSNRALDEDRGGESAGGGQDTGHNHESVRLRMLGYADKGKSVSSLSTMSSTTSFMTTSDYALSPFESEITETEDDEKDERPGVTETRGQNCPRHSSCSEDVLAIRTPGGCGCHFYRGNDAMLYTAHVGDCRAVLLGGSCPRTIKVPPEGNRGTIERTDKTDDSSYSDETVYMSSSGHEKGSSDEEDEATFHDDSESTKAAPPYLSYMRRPARRQGLRGTQDPGHHKAFVALPQLINKEVSCSSDESVAAFDSPRSRKAPRSGYDSIAPRNSSESFGDYQNRQTPPSPPPLYLSPHLRPIELTTDHSVYNPVEAAAVQRRCNNAAGAISSGLAGGIKRVAGSLAVTRALGDAYLKTPLLSFSPFKHHAPYITARPEVSYRLLPREEDRKTTHVLILGTDGVWEQASGEDVLHWLGNYYAKRTDAEKRSKISKDCTTDEVMSKGKNGNDHSPVKELKGLSPGSKKRKLRVRVRRPSPVSKSTAADVIVRRVLNKVRRSKKMSSLHALMSLPKGRARRSKHDDITTIVVDLAAFVT